MVLIGAPGAPNAPEEANGVSLVLALSRVGFVTFYVPGRGMYHVNRKLLRTSVYLALK